MLFNEYNKSDWESIANYLSGEMNQDEMKNFRKRIDFSEENKAYFNQVKKDWEKMDNLRKKEETFDANKAWGKLYSKFEEDGLVETKKVVKVFKLKQLLQIAAIFVFGVALTSLVYFMNTNTVKQNWAVADSYNLKDIKEVKLSDGSIVYLNVNSKLYYPENFDGETRTVQFEGDAFFDIAKNPLKPFIIKAKKAEIKVVGTSFNVNTNKNLNLVEVLVQTGKVQLSDLNKDSSIFIEPGYIGKLDKSNLSKGPNSDVNYLAWKTKTFDFENGIRLENAIEVLNRAYHSNIQIIDKSIADIKLYTYFGADKSFATILQIICETYNLKNVEKDGRILLMPE